MPIGMPIASAAPVESVTSTMVSIVGCQSLRFQRKAKPAAARIATRLPPSRHAIRTRNAIVSHGGTATSAAVEISIQSATILLVARVNGAP
jgi:hypothetical protein